MTRTVPHICDIPFSLFPLQCPAELLLNRHDDFRSRTQSRQPSRSARAAPRTPSKFCQVRRNGRVSTQLTTNPMMWQWRALRWTLWTASADGRRTRCDVCHYPSQKIPRLGRFRWKRALSILYISPFYWYTRFPPLRLLMSHSMLSVFFSRRSFLQG